MTRTFSLMAKRLQIALFIVTVLTACDQTTSPIITTSDTSCSSQEAEIRVSDGYFENLCGCAEAAGTIVDSGTFTCTVKTGTTVFFLYLDTHLEHQIISTGGVPFTSGTLNLPGSTSNNNVGVEFNTAGTANFADAFNNLIQGQIVITN
jgi:hypothetical protein